jgi:toxin ParE1/3/4
MAAFRFSRQAEADLIEIADYTLRTWGEGQVIQYLEDLERCCQLLAVHPESGRSCHQLRPGLRRMEHASHIVFYRQETGGILVSRILHQRMLPEAAALDSDDREM